MVGLIWALRVKERGLMERAERQTVVAQKETWRALVVSPVVVMLRKWRDPTLLR